MNEVIDAVNKDRTTSGTIIHAVGDIWTFVAPDEIPLIFYNLNVLGECFENSNIKVGTKSPSSNGCSFVMYHIDKYFGSDFSIKDVNHMLEKLNKIKEISWERNNEIKFTSCSDENRSFLIRGDEYEKKFVVCRNIQAYLSDREIKILDDYLRHVSLEKYKKDIAIVEVGTEFSRMHWKLFCEDVWSFPSEPIQEIRDEN